MSLFVYGIILSVLGGFVAGWMVPPKKFQFEFVSTQIWCYIILGVWISNPKE